MHPLFMKQKRLLFDGAFGTYYASLYGNEEPCEMANVKAPTRVAAIHEEYLKAGANAIKTNTFAMNEAVLDCSKAKREELLRQGYRIAKRVATPYQASVFADIGPCVETRTRSAFTQYKELVDVFLEEGADCFLFETLPNDHGIHEIAAYLKERCPHVCVLVSFAVTADGYTQQGVPLTKLVKAAHEDENIHGFGLNCICGPMHMRRLLKYFDTKKDTILIMPNAGYPTILANHTYFRDIMRRKWKKSAVWVFVSWVAAAVASLLIFKRSKKDYKKKLCYHFPHRQRMIRFFIRIAILCAKNYKEKKKSYV